MASAGNGQHVEEHDGAFLRDQVLDHHAVAGLHGPVPGLQDVAAPAQGQADLAVGQVLDVLGGVDVLDVRPDRRQYLLGGRQVVRILAVGILAQVDQHGADDLGRRVKDGHAAVLEFRHHLRVVEHGEAVHWRVGHRRLDLRLVVADAGGAPQVVHRVLVARVVQRDALGDLGVQVLQVGELRPVELLEHAGLDLPLEEGGRWHDDVVARAPGEQLGFQHFVGVEDVVLDRDAGLFREVIDDRRVDVIRPVVDVEDLLGVRVDGAAAGAVAEEPAGVPPGSAGGPLASGRRRPRSEPSQP